MNDDADGGALAREDEWMQWALLGIALLLALAALITLIPAVHQRKISGIWGFATVLLLTTAAFGDVVLQLGLENSLSEPVGQGVLKWKELLDARKTGLTMEVFPDSQLGAIGNAVLNARYSRKQESEADDYGYAFLKAVGKNPWGMAMSFEKLQKVAGGSGAQASAAQKLFSSHPDTETRIQRMAERATAEGYKRPAK